MLLRIQHETKLSYSEPVSETVFDVRMAPPSDEDQTNLGYRLRIVPSAPVTIYRDGFGNRVDLFNIITPYSELIIRATSIVRTHRASAPEARLQDVAWNALVDEPLAVESLEYLQPSPLVNLCPELEQFIAGLKRPEGALKDRDRPVDRRRLTQRWPMRRKSRPRGRRSAKRSGWAGGSARISPICSSPPAAVSASRRATSAATFTSPARWPPTPGARSGPARAAGSTSTPREPPSPATTTSRSPLAATTRTCPPTAGCGKAAPSETIAVSVKVEPIDRVPADWSDWSGNPGPVVRLVLGPVPIASRTRQAQPAGRIPPATRRNSSNSMNLEILEGPVADLTRYASLPISFTVDRVLEATPNTDGQSGFVLTATMVDVPYVKDYDSIEGNAPRDWPARFDVSRWGMITGVVHGELIGGAVLAFATDAVYMLENRMDLTVLWDLRVHPDYRRQGVGQSLFQAATVWAKTRMPPAQDRNPEHQCGRLPVLRKARLRFA